MKIKPLRSELRNYARKHGFIKKLDKQILLFTANHYHPSLHTEILEPKELKIYSFRINLKYRAIFIVLDSNKAEIIDINNHYSN